ncbi:ferritin-like domain-containing protein [Ureaplasma canigenitalium]|uniref:ferritin-like domain-containing protein n=1 Tax=Ureaplasma canigenitalium TaxID=42092 RepID=UPI0004E13C77|nr:ferritin-like domain-containing protein [Ureaplasma canigenitalium]
MKKTDEVIKLLNDHYNLNLTLGMKYSHLAHLADSEFDMPNLAKFVKHLSDDKLGVHKDYIVDYFNKAGIKLVTNTTVSVNNTPFKNAKEIIEAVLEEENNVRKHVAHLAATALKHNDFESFYFLQWYVRDGIKDYAEIESIAKLFHNSNDALLVDHMIEETMEANEKEGPHEIWE